jgi:hypothetical protein
MYFENRCEYAFPRKSLRQALRRLLNREAEALMSLPDFARGTRCESELLVEERVRLDR